MPYGGSRPQQWKLPSPLTGEIHGIGSGRCVDVPNGSTTPGTQVQIYNCNGGLAQQWTYDPTSKELMYVKSPSMCLEARGGGTTRGHGGADQHCNGTLAQKWTLSWNGTITNDKSGLFLDAKGGGTVNGTLVQLWNATTGAQGQQQLWSQTSMRGGPVHAVGAGKCLAPLSWENGTQVVISQCYNTAWQMWTYHPVAQSFTVYSPSRWVSSLSGSKCLEASGTAAHATVVINDCTGAASQQWSLDYLDKTITNIPSGLVLHVTGGATADETGVELMPYVQTDTAQQWVWSLD